MGGGGSGSAWFIRYASRISINVVPALEKFLGKPFSLFFVFDNARLLLYAHFSIFGHGALSGVYWMYDRGLIFGYCDEVRCS
jgi:hypothetical protein